MCPLLDSANPHCGEYLTLEHVVRAFAFCTSGYQNCPVYQAMHAPVVLALAPTDHERLRAAC
jgi:predicted metal-binding transcription factor (methanogenesis marker protein 9)